MSARNKLSAIFIILVAALLLCAFTPAPAPATTAPPPGFYTCARWWGCTTWSKTGERLSTHKLYYGQMTKFVDFEYVAGYWQGLSKPTPWSLTYRYHASDFKWAKYND